MKTPQMTPLASRLSAGLLMVVLLSPVQSSTVWAAPQLEEVIVTAQKREQNLQDVPMAITALGRELLKDAEIDNIEDLTKLVPSMRFTPGDDPTNSSIRIRGVGTNVYSIAVEPNVSVVVDEVPLARTALANFEFADLERIEVLRGPQGTLFGKNSTAGLIHVITRDPAPEFEGFARLNYENTQNFPGDQRKLGVGVSGPLSDTLGVRLTAFRKSIDGHLEDITQNNMTPSFDAFGVRTKFRWDPADSFNLRLSLEHQRTDGESTPIVFRNANPEKAARSPEINYGDENRQTKTFGTNRADTVNQAASVIMNWDLEGFTLTSVTGWRGYEIQRDLAFPDLDGSRIDVTKNGGERTIETLTQELRLTSTGSDNVEYTLGALWFDNRLDNYFERRVEDIPFDAVAAAVSRDAPSLLLLGAAPGESFSQYALADGGVDTTNLGVFGQFTWHVNSEWHLTAGTRYIREELTSSAIARAYTTQDATGANIASSEAIIPATSIRDKHVIGTVSLGHDWSENTRLYGSVSTGYRGGAFDLANSDLVAAFANPVDPETALAFELGAKMRLLDNRLELNLAIFQTNFKDFQAQIVDVGDNASPTNLVPAAQFRLANAGELETRGLEVDFKAQVSETLFVFGSFLYNKAEFIEFVTQCFVGQQLGESGGEDVNGNGRCDRQDVAGGALPNAPEKSVSITGRYEKPLPSGDSMAYLQLGGRWLDDIQFSAEQHPLAVQEAYSIWDLRGGWRGMGDKLEIAAYVNNLFAQSYVVGFFPLSLVNDRRDIAHFLPSDADRVMGLSVNYEW
ncbi:MAG: iron complex outermembrane receptor protein [Paracoccaceae bacterium]|jgi:iron complex outermembrane receptor protein